MLAKYDLILGKETRIRKHPDQHFHVCSQRIRLPVQVCCSFYSEKVITKLN